VRRVLFPAAALLLVLTPFSTAGEDVVHKSLIRDITTVEGVRNNPLVGYGMVVGLKGTGDRQQTIFTTQTLANMLQRMGVQVPATAMIVKNVAAVFVTANLPPFARPGTPVDVTISSVGDAKSLEGGLLLLTPLYGVDGRIYAEAQGPLVVGGYRAGTGGNAKEVNHPTVGRIPGGGLVERDTALDLQKLPTLSLLLNDPNFSTAEAVAAAINHDLGKNLASVTDSRQVDLEVAAAGVTDIPALLARVENLAVEVHRRARVVVNERTGTIVMGRDVRLGAVSILHGALSIEITTQLAVSQPAPLSQGETKTVPETTVSTEEAPAHRIELTEGASVEDLVNGLQKIGATARDVIAILQAIKAAGALDADLEVI
jgi:flagellar P-ring protein FlgI